MRLTTPSITPHTSPYLDLSKYEQAKLQEYLIDNGHELTLEETVLFLDVLQTFKNIHNAIMEGRHTSSALSGKDFQQLRTIVVLEFHRYCHYWVVGNCEDILELVDDWVRSRGGGTA